MSGLLGVFDGVRRIAVVGASRTPGKPAHDIPRYLQSQGYELVPVNPNADVVLGVPALASLDDVDEPVDVVLVFRPAEEAPALAVQAARCGARVFWLQEGILSDEADRLARAAGLRVVMGVCMAHSHRGLGGSVVR